ncbi:MAG: YscQ/HrcQ family type III secretion apparatus protein [Thiothrix nivea]|nr:MAG: YscQ/HrcQ family type III secretion apparatus protein [Thiothrix nivea]
MSNSQRLRVTPYKPAAWSAPAMRINNLLLNKSQAYSFQLDENRLLRLRLFPGEVQRQHIFPIGLTLGIGDSTAGLWLSDWPVPDNIRVFIPEGMLSRLPENLGLAITENAMDALLTQGENALASKITLQSLSVEQNSRLYTLPVGFELIEANRTKPEGRNIRTISGLLMLEERLYPLLQERMRFWPSDMNEGWEMLEIRVHLEIGQTRLTIEEINKLAVSDVLLPDSNDFHNNQQLRLRLTADMACLAQLNMSEEQHKTLTITTDWNAMTDEEQQSNAEQINKVPVQLTFDLGHKTMSFNELKQLRPGYVMDLPGNLPEVVKIRAQNKQIGTGELVEIDGRIGIRILSLFGAR